MNHQSFCKDGRVSYVSIRRIVLVLMVCLSAGATQAQTDIDAIMMSKRNFCTGIMYGNSSWTNYWEGTLKRNNENLGSVSTQSISIMGNYGVNRRLNLLFGIPYIQTKASAGQLKGHNGIQDLSLWVKWMPIEKEWGKHTFSVYALGGASAPLTNYVADYLPLSLGLRSKTFSLRGMVDYQYGSWFTTFSGTYVHRSNITIDRMAYYTTEMHYTNEVYMPDALQFNWRAGFRDKGWIVEAVADQWTTLGGFDITRNNMPFPSNRMNATRLGINLKYEDVFLDGLSLTGNAFTTVAGRNMGQANAFAAGVFYIIDFPAKKKAAKQASTEKQ